MWSPQKLNSRGERGLTREFLQDPRLPLTTCVSNYNARLEINDQISYMTAWRLLQRNDIVCRVLRKKPLLNPSHLRARKAFYSANKNKTKSDWKQYAFSDETQILAHPKSGRLYFRKRLEADPSKDLVFPTKAHGGFSIMLWSYITYDSVGNLVKIKG